ncbi:MAG: twin-arginine translocase TatA/TatE family subunit [Fimbriimonadaceae bacterium]
MLKLDTLAFIGPLGTTEMVLILVVILVLFGGKKIPEFFRGVGRGVGELQKGIAESKSALNKSLEDDEKDEKVKPV